MTQEIDFQTIYDDFKSSARLAWKNILSFFLGVIAIGIVLGIATVIIGGAATFFIFSLYGFQFQTLIDTFTQWSLTFGSSMTNFSLFQGNYLAFGVLGILILIPSMAFAFLWIGPIYGMSKEVAESGKTHAESSLRWLRNKFFPFAIAGILMGLIIAGPPVLLYSGIATFFGGILTGWVSTLSSVAIFLWVFFSYGLLSTWLPGIANGLTIQEALQTSVDFARKNFERVYGSLSLFLVLILAVIGPIALWLWITTLFPFLTGGVILLGALFNPITIALMGWGVIGGGLLAIFGLPTHILTYTRIYLILSGKPGSAFTSDEPDIDIMGGM
ncbi:unnamed protein product [marine sediment metagenome]|uniref:Glycerophosphoryl diester phosphodiesterase membrane domain-containing protein n=1 Tax=marine sediment metagenome TaxID=412755 RepID=X1GTF6_9ZZZZ